MALLPNPIVFDMKTLLAFEELLVVWDEVMFDSDHVSQHLRTWGYSLAASSLYTVLRRAIFPQIEFSGVLPRNAGLVTDCSCRYSCLDDFLALHAQSVQ